MRLWEKNYLLTMILFLTILYGSIFFLHSFSFQSNLEKECSKNSHMEQSTVYGIQSLLSIKQNTVNNKKLLLYADSLKNQGIFLSVTMGEEELANTLPFSVPSNKEKGKDIITKDHCHYLLIHDFFTYQKEYIIQVSYLESIQEVYKNTQKQMIFWLLICGFLSVFMMFFLYFSLKKIFQPINNIAHELRTPLTTIQGYAQYIRIGKINQEDILFASGKIDEEAAYINNLIERLLIMEHINMGEIVLEKISIKAIFEELKIHYPNIKTKQYSESISADKTLFFSLLCNLLSNLSRAGGDITLIVSEDRITIHNPMDYMPPSILKKVNNNSKLPKEVIYGKGFGVALCHDIIKMHGWKLHYESNHEDGTMVTVDCHKRKAKNH